MREKKVAEKGRKLKRPRQYNITIATTASKFLFNTSATRFGEISPLWPKVNDLKGKLLRVYLALAIILNLLWQKELLRGKFSLF